MSRLLFCVIACVAPAFAQSHISSAPVVLPPEPTGTVTGHVYCADSNQPARFAKVQLEAIPDPADPAAARSAPPAGTSKAPVTTLSTITDTALDGTFTLRNVKPGSYYVVVEKSGYIKPREMFSPKEFANPSPTVKALIEAVLPRVKVEANQTEHAEVRMERGAAISGTVLYDDGSPAAGLRVKLLRKDEYGKWSPIEDSGHPRMGNNVETDDRGYFRISSLLPNEYLVEVRMDLTDTRVSRSGTGDQEMFTAYSNSRFGLPFYGRGVARQKDATGTKLGSGQETTGVDMTLPISKLHHVTGRVAAGPDSHFVNAASVTLVTRDDGATLATSHISRDDGLFHFDFVPDGDYTLKVTSPRDVVYEPSRPDPKSPMAAFEALDPKDKPRTLQTYGDTEEPFQLDGNRDSITITVPRDAKAPKPSSDANTPATTP